MIRSIINRDPDILGGTPVFMGTRVPVTALFDYLEAGDDLDEFLDRLPFGSEGARALALLRLKVTDLFGTIEYDEDCNYEVQHKRE